MDYRVLAIDELKRLNHNYAAEKVIKSRIIELDETLKSIGGSRVRESMTKLGYGNKTEHKWLNLIASISDEKKRLREVTRAIKRVEAALSSISEDEARILRAVYIAKRNINDVAEKEHISRSTAYRLRDNALISFTRALYGAVVN